MRDLLTRSLPDAVRERLGTTDDAILRGVAARSAGTLMEVRASRIEARQNEDGTFHVSGYATTWDTPYDVAGGAPYGWSERIAKGACNGSLAARDDVRFLVNHEGIALARTKSGTMTLAADDLGLFVDVPSLDLSNPRAQELRSAILRGDCDEMSFAFTVAEQSWNGDYTERTITRIDRLYDVSAVTYPANPATIIGARNDIPVAVNINADAPDMLKAGQSAAAALRAFYDTRDAEPGRFNPRQVAQYKNDETIAETFGKYTQDSGPDGAHYMPVSPFAGDGLACANCAFYDGARSCEIVDGDIAPEGVCKRWIIPADLVNARQARKGGLPLSLALAQRDAL